MFADQGVVHPTPPFPPSPYVFFVLLLSLPCRESWPWFALRPRTYLPLYWTKKSVLKLRVWCLQIIWLLYYCDVERDCPQAGGDEPERDWATSHDSVHDVLVNNRSNAMLVFIIFSTEEYLVSFICCCFAKVLPSHFTVQGCSICTCPFRVLVRWRVCMALDFNITIVQAYAPTSDYDDNEKEEFSDQLQNVIDQTPKKDVLVVQGDWNAKVGRNACGNWQGNCGPFCNEGGLRLLEFAIFNNRVLANTFCHHKASRGWTWHSPSGQHHN